MELTLNFTNQAQTSFETKSAKLWLQTIIMYAVFVGLSGPGRMDEWMKLIIEYFSGLNISHRPGNKA